MKIHLEIDSALPEGEVHIRCGQYSGDVKRLHRLLAQQGGGAPPLVFYKGDQEFFFSPEEILFFETEGEEVWAHTPNDAFRIRYRLYELEEMLPRAFIRAAKSTIVNTAKIYSIKRDFANLVTFAGTHKQVYVSRHYYKELKTRILERSTL